MRNFVSVHLLFIAIVILALSTFSSAQVGISITIGPPALPVYVQPACPYDGYIWTPGYWAYDYDDRDYYWVPGTWVQPPQVGFLWTPGYWGWAGSRYVFYDGYWGPQVGFYGGINYGYGYFGNGYQGGRWDHNRFFYNRSVTNVNVTVIHNVYNTRVINRTVNRVSYNGGRGGISVRPTRQQEIVARERHVAPVAAQTQHMQAARADREQRASINHGRPAVAASPRPGDFKDRGVVRATKAGAPYNPGPNRREPERQASRPTAARPENNAPRPENNNARPRNTVRPNDAPRGDRPAPSNTGVARQDQRREQNQEKAAARQDQERQRVQQQEQNRQNTARQNADEARRQQADQRREPQRAEPQRQQPQERPRPEQRQQPQERPRAQERPQPQERQQPHDRPEPRNQPKPPR